MDGTEREMIVRMQQGEEEAFSWLFQKYQSRVLRMAYLISGNYADSEDILQETFVKCYTYRRHLKDPEKFESWLCQIMTRTAWRLIKKNRREQPAEEIRDEYEPDQMSTKEIARAMGCLEGTVKSRLYTARRHLKGQLDAQEKEGLYEKRTV